jgi:hypothetical protein
MLPARAIEWSQAAIRASVYRDSSKSKSRVFLQFDRETKNPQAAWRELRMELPEFWKIAKVQVEEDGFSITLADGRWFWVRHYDIGALYRSLTLSAANQTSLEEIWKRYERTG